MTSEQTQLRGMNDRSTLVPWVSVLLFLKQVESLQPYCPRGPETGWGRPRQLGNQ